MGQATMPDTALHIFFSSFRPWRLGVLAFIATAAPALAAPAPVDFARDVQPILQANCYACHGPDKQKANFRFDSRASALHAGGVSGKLIVLGDSANSLIIRRVRGLGD